MNISRYQSPHHTYVRVEICLYFLISTLNRSFIFIMCYILKAGAKAVSTDWGRSRLLQQGSLPVQQYSLFRSVKHEGITAFQSRRAATSLPTSLTSNVRDPDPQINQPIWISVPRRSREYRGNKGTGKEERGCDLDYERNVHRVTA